MPVIIFERRPRNTHFASGFWYTPISPNLLAQWKGGGGGAQKHSPLQEPNTLGTLTLTRSPDSHCIKGRGVGGRRQDNPPPKDTDRKVRHSDTHTYAIHNQHAHRLQLYTYKTRKSHLSPLLGLQAKVHPTPARVTRSGTGRGPVTHSAASPWMAGSGADWMLGVESVGCLRRSRVGVGLTLDGDWGMGIAHHERYG